MQILTINNRNFQKPFRNPSSRTKVKILEEKFFWIPHQKNLVPPAHVALRPGTATLRRSRLYLPSQDL
jgi:hypothetical protein